MKIRLIKILALAFVGISCATSLTTLPTYADDNICSPTSGVPDEVKKANGCPQYQQDADSLPKLIQKILTYIIEALGIIAVIFIVMGGFNYMTSEGDAAKIEKAKKTILYAGIGLAICVLSFAITTFIIDAINKA